jgi:cerevisin
LFVWTTIFTVESPIRADFFNYGAPIKVFAPGVNVTSTWIGSHNATEILDGASMACFFPSNIALEGNLPPADMITKVQALAVPDIVKDPGEHCE